LGHCRVLEIDDIARAHDDAGVCADPHKLTRRLHLREARVPRADQAQHIAHTNVPEARTSIGKYLEFYNGRSPHQRLGQQTPDQAYFNALQPILVAA
jgi:hypothetical protein